MKKLMDIKIRRVYPRTKTRQPVTRIIAAAIKPHAFIRHNANTSATRYAHTYGIAITILFCIFKFFSSFL